tara:strand:- start:378 stop:632 length:255 start_codon:yes stop_codon:yes gene_type:complete
MEILLLYMKKLAPAMVSLFIIFVNTNCSSGWSVGNFELTSVDTTKNTVFIEIMAQDSTKHWYANIYNGENYCLLHNEWEEVRIK